MDDKTVRETIRAFITRELIRDERYDLRDDEAIVSAGLIDSFALAELGVFVEQTFHVYIPDPDLTVAKMDTLNQIVARIRRDLPQ